MSSLRRLVVFGDSYVQGYRVDPVPRIENFNFPYYLADELGTEVFNLGHHGHSNLAIANDVMSFIRKTPKDELKDYAFLICFSDWLRQTERNPSIEDANLHHALKGIVWSRWPQVKDPDEATLRITTEMCYLGLKQLCQELDIPYRMINSFDHQNFCDTLDIWVPKMYDDGRVEDVRLGSKTWKMQGPSGDPNWIESGSSYNTLFDIILGHWLMDDAKLAPTLYLKTHKLRKYDRQYMAGCGHPNIAGNKLIARTLAPYLEPIIG